MTDLLEEALHSARRLRSAQQDELARLILTVIGETGATVALTCEEDRSLDLSDAAAARGEFATEAEVRSVWANHGARRPSSAPR